MKIDKTDIVVIALGLMIGVLGFAVGCGPIGPCGDTRTVDEYPVESGTYVEDYYAGDGGEAEVPLRYGHGDKTVELDLETNTLQITYRDTELREIVETWRVENLKEVEGRD